ncbi:MAG: glycosyltransferase family 2 protein, partial [Lachnospiraceae bacterium]|nr:glycosyltransferase family 2 protein [Lachnospiraceae bacterium]
NIIEEQDTWKLIDYEWTFPFPVPVEFIIYRILHYYFETNKSREVLKNKNWLKLSESDRRMFQKMELQFLRYINGERHPVYELYSVMGKAAVDLDTLLYRHVHEVRVYKDTGGSYKKENAALYSIAAAENGRVTFRFEMEEGAIRYLIAPYERGCILRVESVKLNGRPIAYTTNGVRLDDNVFVFEDEPWLEIGVSGKIVGEIAVVYWLDAQISQYCGTLAKCMEDGGYEMLMSYPPFRIQRKYQEYKKKIKAKLKKRLKSNPVTYKAGKKIKAALRGEKIRKEEESVEKVVYALCPQDEWQKQRDTKFPRNIRFSILVPLYNTPERYLKEMIESVQYQTYENWELCLADGSDEDHRQVQKICRRYSEKDGRIKYKKLEKNLGISGNTNASIDMATGDYIALFDHDDFLHPCALFENMKIICRYQADYLYTDEATFEGTNIFHIINKHCKPDFAIDNLRANNYICHFSVFKAELLEKTGGFRAEYDGSQDFDLILRLTEQAEKIFHIRKILYYWRSHPASVASDISAKTYAIDAAKRAVESHLDRMGLCAKVESSEAFPAIFRLRYDVPRKPLISILIPNKDHKSDLEKCIRSILEKSTYDNYEIIIVENNSFKDETFAYYNELEQYEKISVITYEGSFNYARINNFAARSAKGEYLLLLNNDTEVITPEWMEELMMYGQRDDVGVVGAKLFYSDGTVQHAGVVIGMGADRVAGHSHYGLDRLDIGYMGKLYYAQDVSAVTGACMLVKKSIYEEIGGMDERFEVAFNDVDFCLQAREKGYLNIFTPYCELYHYESMSRGHADQRDKKIRFEQEVALFKEKWGDVIKAGDPYFNPSFSLDRPDFFIPD